MYTAVEHNEILIINFSGDITWNILIILWATVADTFSSSKTSEKFCPFHHFWLQNLRNKTNCWHHYSLLKIEQKRHNLVIHPHKCSRLFMFIFLKFKQLLNLRAYMERNGHFFFALFIYKIKVLPQRNINKQQVQILSFIIHFKNMLSEMFYSGF